jgi:esterase/lipase superfamily enzyme
VKREYHKWWSPHLGRDMELLVFGHGGSRLLVFPTRKHHFHEYENMGMVEVLRHRIEQGGLQLYCVDSMDAESFYARHLPPPERLRRHDAYEKYLVREVVPFIRKDAPAAELTTHGCSLGAFHAVNLALRFPHLFRHVIAFSGRYDLTRAVEHFDDLFSGLRNDEVIEHTPVLYLGSVTCDRIRTHWRRMHIQLALGDADPFRENTETFGRALAQQGVPCKIHYWHGRAHDPASWRTMATRLLTE